MTSVSSGISTANRNVEDISRNHIRNILKNKNSLKNDGKENNYEGQAGLYFEIEAYNDYFPTFFPSTSSSLVGSVFFGVDVRRSYPPLASTFSNPNISPGPGEKYGMLFFELYLLIYYICKYDIKFKKKILENLQ